MEGTFARFNFGWVKNLDYVQALALSGYVLVEVCRSGGYIAGAPRTRRSTEFIRDIDDKSPVEHDTRLFIWDLCTFWNDAISDFYDSEAERKVITSRGQLYAAIECRNQLSHVTHESTFKPSGDKSIYWIANWGRETLNVSM